MVVSVLISGSTVYSMCQNIFLGLHVDVMHRWGVGLVCRRMGQMVQRGGGGPECLDGLMSDVRIIYW